MIRGLDRLWFHVLVRSHLWIVRRVNGRFHVAAKLRQVFRRDICGGLAVAVARRNKPGGTGFKHVCPAQPLAKRRLQPLLLRRKCGITAPGRCQINEVIDLCRFEELTDALDLPKERQHMLLGVRNAQRAMPDFLLGGGGLEADDGWRRTIR